MILVIILFAVNLFAKLMCDLIRFKGIPKSDWWLAEGKYSYDKRTVWTKGIFSFISDGWHFFDAVRNMSFLILVCYTLQIPIYLCVIAYLIYGLLFNLFYKLL